VGFALVFEAFLSNTHIVYLLRLFRSKCLCVHVDHTVSLAAASALVLETLGRRADADAGRAQNISSSVGEPYMNAIFSSSAFRRGPVDVF
jgi:hypothetical protein